MMRRGHPARNNQQEDNVIGIRWKAAATVAVLGILAQGMVYGEQFAFSGARATGMGGANIASVNDATAQQLNPAVFGFFGNAGKADKAVDNNGLGGQGFSWELFGAGAGYAMTEDMGRYLDILAGIDFNSFDAGNLSSNPNHVSDLITMAGIVGSLNSSDALYADAAAGTSVQMGHIGIGVRMFGEMGAWTTPDTDNLALDDYASVGDLVTEIDNAAANEGFVWSGAYNLSAQQRTDLATAFGVAPDSDTIKYLDFKFGDVLASHDLTSSEVAGAVDLMNSLVPGGSGSISSNLTTVVGRGFALAEVPISYGWAMDQNLSFGVTAKLMYGSVLGTKIWVFNDNNDQVLDDLSDSRESSWNIGLDAGAMYRIPKFQFALVGHNLNRPTFKGFSDTVNLSINGGATQTTTIRVPDVKLDPQFTAGAAFIPSKRFTLEGNLDLLETGTLLPGYNIQRLSFGGELDLWLLSLRLGAYRNLAASWQDWVGTAGVGVNIVGVKIDVGGAYSLGNTTEYNGNEIPNEARLYGSIGLDF